MEKTKKDSNKTIAVIGAGNVGLSMAQLFSNTSHDVVLGVRNVTSAKSLTSKFNLKLTIKTAKQAINNADIVILAVTDSSIEELCHSLEKHFKTGAIVTHCSGALSSSILQSARESDCHIASTHPLNSFPNIAASLEKFSTAKHGSYLYTEGDQQAVLILSELFEQIGFTIVEIEQQNKVLYHAACVFACNYLTSLMDISLQTAAFAKLDQDEFWQAIQPLIQTTLTNISLNGTSQSLSGPIARGDHETILKHLETLNQQSNELANSYIDLGKHALRLAEQRGELTTDQLQQIASILEQSEK